MDAFQQAWRLNKARQEELRRQDLDPEAQHLLLRQRVQGIQDAQSTLQQYREDDTHPGSERTYAELRDYQTLYPPAPDHRPMTPGFQRTVQDRDRAYYVQATGSDRTNSESSGEPDCNLHPGPLIRDTPDEVTHGYNPVFANLRQELEGMQQIEHDQQQQLQDWQEPGLRADTYYDTRQAAGPNDDPDAQGARAGPSGTYRQEPETEDMYSDEHDEDDEAPVPAHSQYEGSLSSDGMYHGLDGFGGMYLNDEVDQPFEQRDEDQDPVHNVVLQNQAAYDEGYGQHGEDDDGSEIDLDDARMHRTSIATMFDTNRFSRHQSLQHVRDLELDQAVAHPPGYDYTNRYEVGMPVEDPWDDHGSEASN